MARTASNVETAWRFLTGKGLSPAQAAGVIGSMQGESGQGLDPTATNPNGGAYGIAQWLGGRKTALLQQKDPHSITTQLNFLWSELQGPEAGAFKALKATHDPASASHAWQAAFERGAPFEQKYDLRAQNAQQVFNSLKGVKGAPSGSLSSALQAPSSSGGAPAAPAQAGTDGTAVLAALLAQNKPQAPPSSGLQDPSFSSRSNLKLPQGYQDAPSSGGPAPPPSIDPALAAVAQIQPTDVPQPDASSPSPSADVADPNTGPAGGANFGKSHSPLKELIHNGAQAFAVKNGAKVDPSVYASVWAGHKDHVHVAAGPNTIVALGKLAQQMGLTVGENVYFTGQEPARGVHVSDSYHYREGATKSGKKAGEAIDVSGDPRKQDLFAQRVEALYGLG